MAGGDRHHADARLVAALAGGATIEAACQQAGVSERTAFRRLQDIDFRQRVESLRAEALERAAGQLASAATEAVECLRRLLGARSEYVQVQSARAILELAVTVRNEVDIERRLAALESAMGVGKVGRSA